MQRGRIKYVPLVDKVPTTYKDLTISNALNRIEPFFRLSDGTVSNGLSAILRRAMRTA